MDQNRSPKSLKPNFSSKTHLLSWPEIERPRERLISNGADSLSLSELIAILLGTGTEGLNVVEVARGIVGSLENLPFREITFAELKNQKGVGESKAARLIAAIELGKRIFPGTKTETVSMNSSKLAYEFIKPKLVHLTKEVFVVVSLDTKNRPISFDEIASGSSETVTFLPKDIFRPAIRLGASGIICAHNHPSGDPKPSLEDKHLTQRLIEVSKLIGIRFLDHLIVTDQTYFSFMDERVLS